MADIIDNRNKDKEPVRAKGVIKVRIIDEKDGLQTIEHVTAIRIHSSRYVLLIMKDYSPTLGQVDGDLSFLMADGELMVKGIRGCFKQQDNEFTLIIEEEIG